jgi:hypothetical protein
MDNPGDDIYQVDGSYTQWQAGYTYTGYMRWSWLSDDHSGVEVGTSGYLVSKWGQLPVMYHLWWYTPYNGESVTAYFRNW